MLGILLGATLILAVPTRWFLKRHAFQFGMRTIISFGFIFGVISGTAAGSGMFVIAGLSSLGLSGPLLLGTDAAIGFINAATRAVTYWQFDALPKQLLLAGLLMGLVTLPGTWLASRIVNAMGTRLHDKLIEVLIIFGGLYLLYQAMF